MITFMTDKDNSFIVSIENPDEEEQEIICRLREKYKAMQSQETEKMFSGFRCVRAGTVSRPVTSNINSESQDDFLTDSEQTKITEF